MEQTIFIILLILFAPIGWKFYKAFAITAEPISKAVVTQGKLYERQTRIDAHKEYLKQGKAVSFDKLMDLLDDEGEVND